MVTPIPSQAASLLVGGTQPDTNQVQSQDAAVQVLPSEKTDVNTSTADKRHTPAQTWPQRKPLGDLIEPPKSSLDTALEQLNQNMRAWATGVRFDIDPDTQRLVVSLVDNESGEVIRTVPSEAVLQISKMIAEFQGNGINTKA